MPEPLDGALKEIRAEILNQSLLLRAVAAGRRRGAAPSVVRAELRQVTLKSGDRLQVVTYDEARPRTRNVAWGEPAAQAVDDLLSEPFGNWHVESHRGTWQLRVTKSGEAQVHRSGTAAPEPSTSHDRAKSYLLAPDDPLFTATGASAAKRRQVDAFLRSLVSTVDLSSSQPLHVVDLGCGNAYLTFAAYRFLATRGVPFEVTGVDVREDQRIRNTALAEELGCADHVRFVAGTIIDAPVSRADVVLALHACDTATDDALARAVGWRSEYILAAPCCHHDIAAQLAGRAGPYPPLTKAPILRERFGDVLTDALRAALLRLHGYRVDVVEFIDSVHTPRNLMLRARRIGAPPTDQQRAEYAELVQAWQVTPHLATLLGADHSDFTASIAGPRR